MHSALLFRRKLFSGVAERLSSYGRKNLQNGHQSMTPRHMLASHPYCTKHNDDKPASYIGKAQTLVSNDTADVEQDDAKMQQVLTEPFGHKSTPQTLACKQHICK